MKNIRILYVVREFRMVGGIEQITIDKIRNFSSCDGLEVAVLYTSVGARENIYTLPDDVREYFLDFNEGTPYRHSPFLTPYYKYKFDRDVSQALQKTVDEISPDIIVCNHLSFIHMTHLRTSAKIIFESHTASNLLYMEIDSRIPFIKGAYCRWKINRMYKHVKRLCDCVVCLTKGDAVDSWSDARRTEVIPNMTVYHDKVDYCEESKIVISAGRLVYQKDFRTMIRSWREVASVHPDWQLHIYGEGPDESQLRVLISSLSLENNVKILPFTRELYLRMQKSSFFLLSSRYEGFALVLIEAAMNGLPIVSVNCPYGPADLVSDNGILVEPNNINALSQSINHMIEHPEERKVMSAKSRAYAQCYTWDVIRDRWINLFNELVK